MRLRSRRRHVVILRSSAHRAGQFMTLPETPTPFIGRIRRWVRISALVAVIVVRPRWKPLLAGTALTVFGIVEHGSMNGVAMIPGMMLLWTALLTPGDSAIDDRRRQQLTRELAGYSTPAQRRDLEAALDQYSDGVTGDLREILYGTRQLC
jgi:hypothetical protein